MATSEAEAIQKLMQDAKTDFWTSDHGIAVRIEMLSEFVVWRTINRAIQVYALEAEAPGEIVEFEWVTQIDDVTCAFCDGQSGRRYRRGQFMPQLPPHPNCRCHWDVHIVPREA